MDMLTNAQGAGFASDARFSAPWPQGNGRAIEALPIPSLPPVNSPPRRIIRRPPPIIRNAHRNVTSPGLPAMLKSGPRRSDEPD